MREVGIGLIGFGTVGAGMVEGLQRNGDLIAARSGVKPVLRRIADLDLERDRGVTVDASILTRDADALVDDPSVEIVVELVGGTGIARRMIEKALAAGKPVVTANKALLAEHGAGLLEAAERTGAGLFFEASVAGGIPIIQALREGLVANRVEHLYGILNGTCNYILTCMEREGHSFAKVLKEAQTKGYAEADPSFDIDGVDTAHKAVILASLAYGVRVPLSAVHTEGIRSVSARDIEHARSLGYRVKLLAVIKREAGAIEIRVQPTMVPMGHMLASVGGVFNAIMVEGDLAGPTLYYGRGAGRLPTGSAVISDVVRAARHAAWGATGWPVPYRVDGSGQIRAIGEIEARYYLRVSVLDRPGVLGTIASVLGRHNVSIASVIQKEQSAGRSVPVVIVTHPAREREFASALREIDAMREVDQKTVRLRIEDMDVQ